MSRLLVFLGNPGKEYEKTRHNAAWLFAAKIQEWAPFNWKSSFEGALGELTIAGGKVYLYRPGTYMNLSGQGVRKSSDFYKISLKNILVVHDEIELPLGEVQLRKGGGARGHNGLRSIDQYLGNKDYYRLGLGIGRPAHGDVSSYVLGRFAASEEDALEHAYHAAWDAVQNWCKAGS